MKALAYIMMLSLVLAMPGCSGRNGNEVKEPVKVKVQRISYTQANNERVFMGHVEAAKSSLVTTSYPGRLVKIKVRKGQNVQKGAVLAVIESPSVKSLYESSKATMEQAKDALDRVNKVYATGSITQLKLVEVQTSYAKAESAYKAAARALADCNVRAPYSGMVGEVLLEEGVEIMAAEPIVRFMDMSAVEVHASIPENEYTVYTIGQSAKIEIDAINETKEGELLNKGYEASPLSHSYDFIFKVNGSQEKMMPGMVCKIYMSGTASNSVVIPSACVRVDTEGRYVWCIDEDGIVVKKHVNVAGFSGEGVIVYEGLEEGDLLIVEGGRKVSSGMRNIVVDEG